MTLFQLRPSEIRKEVIRCMEVGLVPMVTSSPGLGKSSIFRQIAKDFELDYIDLRLSQCAPEDLMGLPMRAPDGYAEFAPFRMFPTERTPLPKGKNGWILALDEINSAPRSVQAASYKLALDHMVGQEKLHPNCYVVAAGNLATDRAIVNEMGTAMQSRLVHLEMRMDHKEFMAHAAAEGFDYRILGFLEFQPSKLHTFKPDHSDKTFACPRTWEFASKLVKGVPSKDISKALMAGALSDGVAVELCTFMDEFDQLPRYEDLIKDPQGTALPDKASTRYAIVSMAIDRVTESSFEKAAQYVRRLTPEFQVIYFRGVIRKIPKMKSHPDYVSNIAHLVKFLNEDIQKAA